MTAVEIRQEEAIGQVISKKARNVERLAWGEWRFLAGNGRVRTWGARLEHNWLTAQTNLGEPGDFWDVASCKTGLASLVKFGVARGGNLVLRGELPIDSEANLAAQTTELFQDINRLDHSTVSSRKPEAGVETDLKVLSAGLSESGWDVQEKNQDQLSVSLTGRAGLNRAVVTRLPAGRLAAKVRLLKFQKNGRHVRSAIGLLLLRSSACLRLVRGAVLNSDSVPEAGFLSVLPQSSAAGDVAEALRALGLACEWCGAELRALDNNPQLAVRYLELQGFPMVGSQGRHAAIISKEKK